MGSMVTIGFFCCFLALAASMLLAYHSLGSSFRKKEAMQETIPAQDAESKTAESVFADSLDEPVR